MSGGPQGGMQGWTPAGPGPGSAPGPSPAPDSPAPTVALPAPARLTRGAAAAIAGLLVVLVLVQVTLVAFLPVPVAVPDLVVVAVLALGHVHGPVVGGLVGVWAGLLLDLVPPAAGPLGGWMLVLGLAGAAIGWLARTGRPSAAASLGQVAGGAGLVVLARAAGLWFAGVPMHWPVLAAAAGAALWALLLAPAALLLAERSLR